MLSILKSKQVTELQSILLDAIFSLQNHLRYFRSPWKIGIHIKLDRDQSRSYINHMAL
jgi:hypothetical protein